MMIKMTSTVLLLLVAGSAYADDTVGSHDDNFTTSVFANRTKLLDEMASTYKANVDTAACWINPNGHEYHDYMSMILPNNMSKLFNLFVEQNQTNKVDARLNGTKQAFKPSTSSRWWWLLASSTASTVLRASSPMLLWSRFTSLSEQFADSAGARILMPFVPMLL